MAKNKRVIKLGEFYFDLSINAEGQLDYKPLSKEDAIKMLEDKADSVLLLDEPVSDPDVNPLQETLEKSQKEILESLDRNIKKVVLKCLGFSDSWGRWEVDHCNSRMSEIGNLITVQCKDLLKQFKPEDLTLSKKEMDAIRDAYRKDLIKQYEWEIKNQLWHYVKHFAQQDAKAIAEKVFKEQSHKIAEVLIDKLVSGKPI